MSSLRNSMHRRQHKERSQLSHRTRLGFLEKHKDYVLRARDYHSKQDRLQRLRQKAADRNKDEFYFGMIRGKTQEGVHVQDKGSVSLPDDIVKVLKTQDENYIRTMRTAGLKKIDKLKNQLSMLADLVKPTLDDGMEEENGAEDLDEQELAILVEAGVIPSRSSKKKGKGRAGTKSKHIVFAGNEEEARSYTPDKRTVSMSKRAEDMEVEEAPLDLGWKVPNEKSSKNRKGRKSTGGDEDVEMDMDPRETKAAAMQHKGRLLKELSARLWRDKMLRYAERELEMQRLLMGKGARRKLRGVEKVEGDEEDEDEPPKKSKVDEKLYKPRVYKWRFERKR